MSQQIGQLGEGGAKLHAFPVGTPLEVVNRMLDRKAIEAALVADSTPIPADLCGVGGCVYLPHALGTKHSWAPGPLTRRLGETIRDAERREADERRVSWRGRD